MPHFISKTRFNQKVDSIKEHFIEENLIINNQSYKIPFILEETLKKPDEKTLLKLESLAKEQDCTLIRSALKDAKEVLLPIYKDDEFIFFINEVKKKDCYLYKINKTTRIKNTDLIKKILKSLMQDLKVISNNLSTSSSKHKLGLESKYFIKDLEELKNINFNYVEIGFGSARFLLNLARNNKDKLILGFEIYNPSILQALNQIHLENLNNLFICKADARIAIRVLNPTLQSIFIHFPVPWNDSKKRRLFSYDFLEEALKKLEDDGSIRLRSDDYLYIKDALIDTLDMKEVDFHLLKNEHIDTKSKYEDRWLKQNKTIYTLNIFKNKSFLDLKNEAKNSQIYEFSFKQDCKTLGFLQKSKFLFKEFFISFKHFYKSQDDKVEVLAVSFGDFKASFNTYLIRIDCKIDYVIKPLSINLHKSIHEKIILICNAIK